MKFFRLPSLSDDCRLYQIFRLEIISKHVRIHYECSEESFTVGIPESQETMNKPFPQNLMYLWLFAFTVIGLIQSALAQETKPVSFVKPETENSNDYQIDQINQINAP